MRVFSLCTFVRFETTISPSIRLDIILQNFKKHLDSFSSKIERKRSKKYLVITLAGKKKALSDFLASSSALKKADTGKPA